MVYRLHERQSNLLEARVGNLECQEQVSSGKSGKSTVPSLTGQNGYQVYFIAPSGLVGLVVLVVLVVLLISRFEIHSDAWLTD